MERKIGEIFECNGEWFQCVESDSCGECSLFTTECGSGTKSDLADEVFGECSKARRSDNKCVIFKKLEKVGEPVTVKGRTFQKLTSDNNSCKECVFNVPNKACCKNSYIEGICDDNGFWVEIKQNKEDMEEKKVKLDQLVTDYTSNKITYNEFEKAVKELYADKEESKPSLKPFSLEEAKAGKPVCTRDGRKARIICFDRKDVRPIVALIKSDNGDEGVYYYYADGLNLDNYSSVFDLMMLPEKKEGWVNVYRDCDGVNITKDDNIYSSKDAAISSAQIIDRDNYVATTIIKWEDSYDSSNNDTNNIHNCMFYLQY